MGFTEKIQNWIAEKLIKRFLDSFLRKVFAALAALIAAQTFPGAAELGAWVVQNSGDWVASIMAAVLALVSLVWGFQDKVKTNEEIKKKVN